MPPAPSGSPPADMSPGPSRERPLTVDLTRSPRFRGMTGLRAFETYGGDVSGRRLADIADRGGGRRTRRGVRRRRARQRARLFLVRDVHGMDRSVALPNDPFRREDAADVGDFVRAEGDIGGG